MLQNLGPWDYALLVSAALVAVYTLTVLMNGHRRQTVERLRNEVKTESDKAKSLGGKK